MVGNLNSRKVLVTGGTGYLGARIDKSLAEQGYDACLGSGTSFLSGGIVWSNQVFTDWRGLNLSSFKSCGLVIILLGIFFLGVLVNPIRCAS